MKHLLTLLLVLPLFGNSQTLVSIMPQQRTALLEEFTAINCGNCPAAHAVATNLFTQYNDQLVGVEVHGGSLANPSSGQPDFRTTDGTALWSVFGVNFQPQGTVNREALSGASSWSNAVSNILSQTSPANIGIAATVENGMLTVDVEVYYTSTPANNDEIHVALTQDHIIGYQQDYGNGAQQNYDHRHVLRDMITDVAGDPVAVNTLGTLVERTYTLTLDLDWTIADLRVVAFIGPTTGAVYQVKQVNADGGITMAVDGQERHSMIGAIYPVPATDAVVINVGPTAAGHIMFLRDATGRVVLQERVGIGATNVIMNVSGLAAGLYTAGFIGSKARMIIVE
ncbi:MAG: Omp28-related outer membrane protein [Flavobacteriales bacterium]|nr:Omp28-related outer membrane protein [Flavobacteriales bacterium]MBK6944027.1 Omp28-related outer membrane protein [Flavobacteriales bacterium]MBK7240233.1 Omp28-related outer membrane protein [Flavobacteriales bacterium]MBK9533695.1 Omp28-related outer membrane protein [Flavobacteriales bacterium]MBP9136985.1 Omp28-related outer membrane protein [Flavobacteriales bacterium]